MEELNGKLEDVYKKGVAAIREVDSNHIILLGGAQWNGNFKPFKDSKFDDKIMYTATVTEANLPKLPSRRLSTSATV